MSERSIHDLLAELERVGVQIRLRDRRLALTPKSLLSKSLLEEVTAKKPELMSHLLNRDSSISVTAWDHVARQVLEGEFHNGPKSLLESIQIGLRSTPSKKAEQALELIQVLLK